ncbi:MAG: DMT family transporter [Lachnospiraceae bacterium]|nr:DMT family transporter [Lachnospiraceae bacterium]
MTRHTKAILFVLLEAVGFSLMSFFVRLAGDLPTMEKAFFRNAVAAVVALVILLRSPEKMTIQKGSLPLLLLRSTFGVIGIIANFWAIDHLAIADANILNKLSPFFAILMSVVILHELPGRIDIVCVIMAFTGALFVIRPTQGVASFPALIGAMGGFAAGTAYTILRKLRLRGERGPVIVFFFSVFSLLVCLPQMLLGFQPMSPLQFLCLLCAGCSAALGQLSITKAYSLAPAREISVFDYSQVIFAGIWGLAFLGEVPDRMSLIGYAVIIAAAFLRWYAGKKHN